MRCRCFPFQDRRNVTPALHDPAKSLKDENPPSSRQYRIGSSGVGGNDDHTGTKNMASRKEIHAAGPEWGSARFAPQILWLFQILDRPEMPQVRKRDLRDIPQGVRQPRAS